MMEMKVNGFELLNHFSSKQAMVLNCKTNFQRASKQEANKKNICENRPYALARFLVARTGARSSN